MDRLQHIYDVIAKDSFGDEVLQEINNYIKDIQNGTEDFSRFNLSEHAGLSKGGAPLIGASIIACYATASITASCNAEGREGSPANWEIDEYQEKLIEQWARAANLWEDDSEKILTEEFGPMIAQGAEAKVYYSDGNTSVVKERTSIYSTWQKALDAIVLHNCLFPETAMKVIGFTRDSHGDRYLSHGSRQTQAPVPVTTAAMDKQSNKKKKVKKSEVVAKCDHPEEVITNCDNSSDNTLVTRLSQIARTYDL